LFYTQYEELLFEVSAQNSPGEKESHIHPFPEKKARPDYRHWFKADVLWQIGFVYKRSV
jgi:hypothetical protein